MRPRQRLRCRQFLFQILPKNSPLFHIAGKEVKAFPRKRQRRPPRLLPERRKHLMSRVEQFLRECKPQKTACAA